MRPKVDRRRDSLIARSALDEVKAIQTLLSDVYKDAGDGRTLVRELVQNADDAKAERLVFAVVEEGLSYARNTLMNGPALLVANDGAFAERDWNGLHQAIGGAKTDDPEKIGRFGVGLKSVFHICEAFLYVGAERDHPRPRVGVLNPWAGTGTNGTADPLHPDWDTLRGDEQRMLDAALAMLTSFDDGLLLWIPLRRPEHLDRVKERPYGLRTDCVRFEDVVAWFDRPESLALLLAQCGHLHSIKALRARTLSELGNQPTSLGRFERPNFESRTWVGRYPDDDVGLLERTFEGRIDGGDVGWSVAGVDAVGLDILRRIRSDADWPQDPLFTEKRLVPRKALAHAAITILRRHSDGDPNTSSGVRLRWAVFLPLDDDPRPPSNAVVETVCSDAPDAWDIVMHGYFWPSQDRKSIPGVTDHDDGAGASETRMRALWNRSVRSELLLPLLPRALAHAVASVSEDVAWRLLTGVASAENLRENHSSVTRKHVLLPVVTEEGVRWEAHVSGDARVLAIPAWKDAPNIARATFVRRTQRTDAIVFIDADAPRIADEPGEWTAHWIEVLLNCVSSDVLRTPPELAWVRKFVRHVLSSEVIKNDERSATVARWIAKRVGEGALSPVTGGAGGMQEGLRHEWRRLFAALPEAWLIDARIESRRAVVELSTAGVVGAGLLPIPLGTQSKAARSCRPASDLLDRALLELGNRLADGEGASQQLQRSRLSLAETLLSVRDDRRPLEEDLARLPLLWAVRLPDGEDEAWSVEDLTQRTILRRVFARSRDREDAQDGRADHRQAATELAEALGEAIWLVDGATASLADVPPATSRDALAGALLRATTFAPPAQRIALTRRLAIGGAAPTATIRAALRTLLAGDVGVREECDLYVQSNDTAGDDNRKTLEVLLVLRGQEWRAVNPELVEPLQTALLRELQVRPVDADALQLLLDETLRTPGADWSGLEETKVLHLLRRLYGTDAEDRRRWRAMPVHRYVGGDRGIVDQRTLRAVGERRLPRGLKDKDETHLLDPDPEVEDLYRDVRPLDDNGILSLMLRHDRPDRFAKHILDTLWSDSKGRRRVILPKDDELLDLLADSRWLPSGSGGLGWAPAAMLDLPEELRMAAAPLVTALGGHRLPEAVDTKTWQTARHVVHEILGRPGRVKQLRRLADALDTEAIGKVVQGRYLILCRSSDVDLSLIEDAIQSPLVGTHPGWRLVRHAASAVGLSTGADAAARDAVVAVAGSLSATVSARHQVWMLNIIAETRPSRNSRSGRLFRRLLTSFATADGFFMHVLPYIALSTQDGQWRPAEEVARSPFGVARRHRLVEELRSAVDLDSDEPGGVEAIGDRHIWSGPSTDAVFRPYFEPWDGRINRGAVGAFLSLLGDGRDCRTLGLAKEWLGDDVTVAGVRRDLDAGNVQSVAGVNVFVKGARKGNRVDVVNLLGKRVEMEADTDNETIFATEPTLVRTGDFWEVELRDVGPRQRSDHELTALLGKTAEWWAERVLSMDHHSVKKWWERWGTGSQTQVAPVRASILAHLPYTLRQLGVRDSGPLQDAVTHANRAQRRRAEVTDADTICAERRALDRLAELIEEPMHQCYALDRVRRAIEESGYQADSMLLELIQNADDALSQAAEIVGGPLPPDVCRVVVRVHDDEGQQTIDLKHYGRSINYPGDVSFAAKQDREWDQDLYFMMVMHLSSKPGEAPGETAAAATTGLFGLGFKSVHLVTEAPSVVSDLLAFSVAGGLLPVNQSVPNDPEDLVPIGAHRATRFRLPLRRDLNAQELTYQIFRRFRSTYPLLPAFARGIRQIVVDGGPYPGVSTFDGEPIANAPGWSVAKGTVEIRDHGTWRLLRYRPGDADTEAGTEALVMGLRDRMPASFPSDLPFLWNVTPTSECWGCGYAVSGPFKLDHGRTHVSLGHPTTQQVVDRLGDALGNGLTTLHDAFDAGVTPATGLPVGENNVAPFVTSLWDILTSGIDNRDDLRHKFLLRLQGNGRGVSAWMSGRSVVPSKMPAPFRQRLPRLVPGMRIEQAVGGLDDPDLCATLTRIEDLARLAQGHQVVSGSVARRLSLLRVDMSVSDIDSTKLFWELAERWDHELTPERLHALRPLVSGDVWRKTAANPQQTPWYERLIARASDRRTLRPLGELLLPSNIEHFDSAIEDELRRAVFAPDTHVLDDAFIADPDDVIMFLRLRKRHRINADTMAGWFTDLVDSQRPAALHYLLDGALQQEILQRLVPLENRPQWLAEYDDVRRMLSSLDVEHWRRNALLAALFPEMFRDEAPVSPLQQPTFSNGFFDRLQEWWDDPCVRQKAILKYEIEAWPEWLRRQGIADGLGTESRDHWLGLLVLGACRGLGLKQDVQHKGFLERSQSEGWWNVFRNPDEPELWMEMLRTWQDGAEKKLEYSLWMSLFPTIYQCSRYLSTYRRLLLGAGQRPEDLYNVELLLAPRPDPGLTGAGEQFDAPPAPLNMGVHWILRELVRLRILDGDHLLPDCWVPSRQVLDFLGRLGLRSLDDGAPNSAKARSIFDFLVSELNTPMPHLHYSFDIPLRHIAANEDLRRELGLEN